ncbi:hypothetical protein ACFCZ3_19950 [Cellulosimicrobium cellulans]|uniref:hypothetical protein n=1 Tax=Cellulosimicrobium cellulans TaxID=1710 RepID=UPI0035DBFB1E
MADLTPTVAQMREGYCAAQNLARETPEQHYLGAPAPDYGAEFDRGLAAHDDAVRQEQRELDLALHRAYRPEVVAEVAVALGDHSDWEQIAAWCGGKIVNEQDPSGEYASLIEIPGVGAAGEDSWIVQRLDGTFAIRATVVGPDGDTLDRVRAETRDGLLARLRFLVDARAEYTHDPTDPTDPIATEVNAGSLLLAILSGENDATGWLPSWKWDAWKALIEEADRA